MVKYFRKGDVFMNVFILTDIEGIPGVNNISDIEKGTEKYTASCKALEECINFAISACKKYGADKIWYLDGHAGGGNVDEKAILTAAKKADIEMWQTLLKNGEIDLQIELGSHARAGTHGAFLDHTISSSRVFSHKVCGIEQSELSLHALLCGAYDVPVALCIGDEAACRQAKEYIPGIITAPIKTASCRNLCISYENSNEIIDDAIMEALREYHDIKPYKLKDETEVEITYYRTDYCEEAFEKSADNVKRYDARTLSKTVAKITCYEDLKI